MEPRRCNNRRSRSSMPDQDIYWRPWTCRGGRLSASRAWVGSSEDKHRSRLSRGRKPSLPDAVFLCCLNEFWDTVAPDQATMSFENAAFAPGSPGRVFLLDEDDIVDRLERLDQVSDGTLSWSETAGLRQIIRVEKRSLHRERRVLQEAMLEERVREAA